MFIPIQIKPCTFYDVQEVARHYFASKAEVINLDKCYLGKSDETTASALRDQKWCDIVEEFKEKVLKIKKQEIEKDE